MSESTGFIAVLSLVALAIIFGTVGTMDRHDAEQQAHHCSYMVEMGAWPKDACND